MVALAGLGWLAFFTYPARKNYLALYLKVLGFVAELSLMFWLHNKSARKAFSDGIGAGRPLARH